MFITDKRLLSILALTVLVGAICACTKQHDSVIVSPPPVKKSDLINCFSDLKDYVKENIPSEKIAYVESQIDDFANRLNSYMRKHTDLVFSEDLSSPGSYLSFELAHTHHCIMKKQRQENVFLIDKRITDSLLKNWLADAEPLFFDRIKQLAGEAHVFEEMQSALYEIGIEKQTLTPVQLRRLQLGNHLLPLNRDSSFSKKEIAIINSMERLIIEEFMNMIKLQIDEPYTVKKIMDGHVHWMRYRKSLLSLYTWLNMPPEIIQLRLLCFNLARIYLYRNYNAFFSQKGEKGKCMQDSPREYSWMYDCSIIRKPLNMPPELPCFAK